MAIVFSRFAPTDEDPAFREIADRKRPDHALARALALIAVAKRELAFFSDRIAQRRKVPRVPARQDLTCYRRLARVRGVVLVNGC